MMIYELYNFTAWKFMAGKDIARFQKNQKEVSRKREMNKRKARQLCWKHLPQIPHPGKYVPHF